MKFPLFWRLLLSLASVTLLTRGVPHDYPFIKDSQDVFLTEMPFHLNTLRNLPRLPNGHKQFQFFNLDPEGNLHKQWMSLQEVQNIILAYALSRHSEMNYLKSPSLGPPLKGGFVSKPLLSNAQKSPEASVDDVLANVQKVMSKEITNTFLKNDLTPTLTRPFTTPEGTGTTSTPSYNDASTYTTLPSTLLTYLMEEQMAFLDNNNPWGIMTKSPGTKVFSQGFFTTDAEGTETTSLTLPETTLDEDTLLQENFLVEGDKKTGILSVNSDFTSTIPPLEISTNFPVVDNGSVEAQATDGLGVTKTTTPFSSLGLVPQEDIMNFLNEVFLIEDGFSATSTIPPLKTDEPTAHNEHQDHISLADAVEISLLPLNYTTYSTEIEHTTPVSPSGTTIYILPNYVSLQITESDEDKTPHTANVTKIEKIPNTSTLNITGEDLAETAIPESYLQRTQSNVENISTAGFSMYPHTSLVGNQPNKSDVTHLISKSSNAVASSNFQATGFENNVLTPLEIAQLPQGSVKNLAKLQTNENYDDYQIDDSPLYLEDLTKITYDYEDSPKPVKLENSSHLKPMDFPSPQTAISYHRPEHVGNKVQRPDDSVNFLQFLPAYNPTLAEAENPLRKTPPGNQGLYLTVANLDPEIRNYVDTMNEVAFQVYKEAMKIHRRQNLVMSPLNLISALSMLVLGARNATAYSLSHLLQGDRFLRFNPHLVLKNITSAVLKLNNMGHESAFVNNLFIEKSQTDSLPIDLFTRILDHFYKAMVEEASPEEVGSIARDRANEKVREQTNGAVQNFLKPNASFQVLGPLSAVSSAYFQGKWDVDFSDADLIDMNFIRFPSAERRLIRTVGISKRMQLNAGYSEEMDATVAEVPLNLDEHDISLVLVMPGQQKSFVANGLVQLERSLTSERWNKLLKSVIPHTLNFKMPIFSHRNYLNLSGILSRIGLKQLFEESADFSGINGAKNLYLGDVVQLSEFHSCKLDTRMFSFRTMKTSGKKNLDLMEEEKLMKPRSSQGEQMERSSSLGKLTTESEALEPGIRQSTGDAANKEDKIKGRKDEGKRSRNESSEEDKTLAYDRAFFYVLRHNPTGFILFIGRYLDPETF